MAPGSHATTPWQHDRETRISPPALSVRLFGELDLRQGGVSLPPLESGRATSLLAYLLLHRGAPQPRQHLAFLLWPDSSEAQARTNLRHVLHHLRRWLPNADLFIDATPRTLQWREDAPVRLDVATFEQAIARAEKSADEGIGDWRAAVDLYAGDLLEGLYDEWLLGERERLRQQYLTALERLAAILEARGEPTEAIQYAERLLRHDPLHEATYRLLMRLHDARGDRARAIRVYHACAATLERELGIEPSASTREAYEALLPVEREAGAPERPEGRIGGSHLVGRVTERRQLTALWRATERGQAQLVLVTGEPGIGKTRLIEDFRSWCVHRGAAAADARSYPAEGAIAYGPVVAWLRAESLKVRRERLSRAHLAELGRLLPELATETATDSRPEPLSEGEQRQRLFDALAGAILSQGSPLLLIADDIHWCDRETLRFLHYLLRLQPEARLLVAATARREEVDHTHPLNDLITGLQALERFTEIELPRLSREETAQLAGNSIDESDADRLYQETEGNPLFVVEALRAGWRRGNSRHDWATPKVQAVIRSRLLKLSEPARDLVGVAATIGRAFTSDVLEHASDANDADLVAGLDELWRRRVIRERDANAYDFSHDRVREVAYQELSPARRRHYHLRVAQALEQLHAADPAAVSGQIARHYELGGATDHAIGSYQRAADAALQLHASHEAIRLLNRALDLLRVLPTTPERDVRELELLTALPGPIAAAEGFDSARLPEIRRRAFELADSIGIELAPPLLRSLALSSLTRDEFETAERIGRELRERGERDADDVLIVEAEYVLGIAAFWSGKLDAARAHFESAVAHFRPEHRRHHLHRYGQDTSVICLSRLANTLWFLGHPDAAARTRDTARALADQVGHPYTRSVVLIFSATLALDMRDPATLRECVSIFSSGHADDVARQTHLSNSSFAGYLDVLDGQPDAGLQRVLGAIEEAQRSPRAPGARAALARVLLEVYALVGDATAGLAAADQALTTSGVRLWEAEVRRLRARFLRECGAPAEQVDAELHRALNVARRQGARMFELRTLVSLARHRAEHGEPRGLREALDALAGLVATVDEGHDTPDLRDALTLLANH